MQHWLLVLAALGAVKAQITTSSDIPAIIEQPSGQPDVNAPANSLELGAACGADAQCKYGAQCWGSNVMVIRRCGNFNAACTANTQCAFNTCNNGLCNGFIQTSTTMESTTGSGTTSSASTSTTGDAAGTSTSMSTGSVTTMSMSGTSTGPATTTSMSDTSLTTSVIIIPGNITIPVIPIPPYVSTTKGDVTIFPIGTGTPVNPLNPDSPLNPQNPGSPLNSQDPSMMPFDGASSRVGVSAAGLLTVVAGVFLLLV